LSATDRNSAASGQPVGSWTRMRATCSITRAPILLFGEVGSIERHIEEEPQRRHSAVDLGRARSVRRQMQPVAAHIFFARSGGRSAEKRGEILDPLHVVMLGLWRELADRHVFDHAPAQSLALLRPQVITRGGPLAGVIRTSRGYGRMTESINDPHWQRSGLGDYHMRAPRKIPLAKSPRI
jgi:hypothetical protein